MTTSEVKTPATRMEQMFREYTFEHEVQYAYLHKDSPSYKRGPLYPSAQDLLDAGPQALEKVHHVNKRAIRSFTIRKYDTLRILDIKSGHVVVLIDDFIYDVLTS